MSYYPEPDVHVRDKAKVVLDLSNHVAEKNKNMQQVLIHLI